MNNDCDRAKLPKAIWPNASARQADALLHFVAALAALLQATMDGNSNHTGSDSSELFDQDTSGLGRRQHCRAWREGKLKGRKVGRRILVTREDRDRYLELYGMAAICPAREAAMHADDPIDRKLASIGFRTR
jgi:hypothetical protein